MAEELRPTWHDNNINQNKIITNLPPPPPPPAPSRLTYDACECLKLEPGKEVGLVILSTINTHTIMVLPLVRRGLGGTWRDDDYGGARSFCIVSRVLCHRWSREELVLGCVINIRIMSYVSLTLLPPSPPSLGQHLPAASAGEPVWVLQCLLQRPQHSLLRAVSGRAGAGKILPRYEGWEGEMFLTLCSLSKAVRRTNNIISIHQIWLQRPSLICNTFA